MLVVVDGGLNLISDPRPFLAKKIRLPVQIRFDAVKNYSLLLLQNTAAKCVAAVLEREQARLTGQRKVLIPFL